MSPVGYNKQLVDEAFGEISFRLVISSKSIDYQVVQAFYYVSTLFYKTKYPVTMQI